MCVSFNFIHYLLNDPSISYLKSEHHGNWYVVCLFACLPAYLPACLLVCLLPCLLVCLLASLLVCLACLPACLPACLTNLYSAPSTMVQYVVTIREDIDGGSTTKHSEIL